MTARRRILVLAAKAAYQTQDFASAAERLGVDVLLATDRCHVLAEVWAEGALAIDFIDPAGAAEIIAEYAAESPIHGVVATDEKTAVVAAVVAARLGVRHNAPDAVRVAGNKLALRRALTDAGLPQPEYRRVHTDDALDYYVAGLDYPVVVKPLHLSASRGVMRADDEAELRDRVQRLKALLADAEVSSLDPDAASSFLIEAFVPGAEVAYEGLLAGGQLHTLAIFDKPDPLDGPFFAETLYVAPSIADHASIEAMVTRAATAIGLREGPVHAELRLSGRGPIVLEIAARSIGGLCGRSLTFGAGISLEELVIAHALGDEPASLVRTGAASTGVAMLPVPESGVLREIEGIDDAREVEGVDDVVITARLGDTVVPLPEGHTYMGFVFATGDDPDRVTRALRTATERIRFHIAPLL